MLVAYVDGASSGNPGNIGIGVVLKKDGETIKELSKPMGKGTNNVAEYLAVIEALKLAKRLGEKKIKIYSDSQLVVNQILGKFKIRQSHLRELYNKVKEIGVDFEIEYIRREKNVADRLAKKGTN